MSNGEGPGPGQKRGIPLATYFAGFGLALVLPALVFAAYLLIRFTELERSRYQTLLSTSADGIAARVDRELSNSVTVLRVLATSDLLLDGRLEEFHRRASGALRGTASYVLLLDLDGRQLLNTRVPFGTELGPSSNPESVTTTLERGVPFVSDQFHGRLAEQPVFSVTYPVSNQDGDVESVLVLTRNSADLAERIDISERIPGITVTIVDQGGHVMAQSSENGLPVGATLPDDIMALVRATNAARWSPVAPDPSNEEDWVIARPLALADWSVVLHVPEDVVHSTADRSWTLLAAVGLGLLALTGGLAILFGRLLARPMQRLARDARAFGQGQTIPARQTLLSEVNEVSAALANAAEERTRRLDHVEILLKELAHRVKNQLAIIQSMARLVARRADSLQAFQAGFLPRLDGLARSVDALTNQDWQGARLSELVGIQLEPFLSDSRSSFSLHGPDLMIKAMAVQRLGLALHELATNASKYGAWSVAGGRVDLSVACEEDGGETMVRLTWRESGGPPVEPPGEKGFGQTLIDDMLRATLSCDVSMTYPADGFMWEVRCALSALGERLSSAEAEPTGP